MSHLPCLLILMMVCGAIPINQVSRARIALRELAVKARVGDSVAMYELARLHDIGYDSIAVDSAESTRLYRMAAVKGYPKAQNYLGFRYLKGEYVTQDIDSGLFWLEKAALNGDPAAANNLGFLYYEGTLLSRDYAKSEKWLRKADEKGVPQAASLLGDIYQFGHGVSPDTTAAIGFYEKAMAAGLHDTELKLISMMGKSWQKLPADSAVNLGRRYLGHNAPRAAVILLGNAADKGNADALALMGLCYSRGLGVGYDYSLSNRYLLEAARKGQHSAQFLVAELLDMLPDVFGKDESDVEDATYWYGKAAEAGITDATEAITLLLSGH